SLIWVLEHRQYSHPLQFIPTPSAKELGITFRPGIRIAYVTTIRNQHSETVDKALVSPNSISGPKFRPGTSDSLDYTNRWRSPHTEPACHGDRKSCSIWREISSPRRTRIVVRPGVETTREAPIRNRHFDPIGKRSHSEISAKELGITFRPGIEIAYMNIIQKRHSETVDRALVSQNSIPGPKFCLGVCVLVHRLSCPLGRTLIFVRAGVETACEAPIRNRYFEPVGPGFLWGQ
ncbi:hypothetical protein Taro_024594, partial [Colocasia esculenta]|nr:hypothetical protein [Colocasia esculenta]